MIKIEILCKLIIRASKMTSYLQLNVGDASVFGSGTGASGIFLDLLAAFSRSVSEMSRLWI
jgi:hypothetical protein